VKIAKYALNIKNNLQINKLLLNTHHSQPMLLPGLEFKASSTCPYLSDRDIMGPWAHGPSSGGLRSY